MSKGSRGLPRLIAAAIDNDTTYLSQQSDWNLCNTRDSFGRSLLMLACLFGHEGLVLLLLQRAGASIDVSTMGGKTAVSFVVAAGHLRILHLLLTLSTAVNVNARDSFLMTPLMMACESEYYLVVERLLRHGGDPNLQDCTGATALHRIAAGHGQVELAKLLLNAGANVSIRDRQHRTPLYIATIKAQTELARWLMQHQPTPRRISHASTGIRLQRSATRDTPASPAVQVKRHSVEFPDSPSTAA